MEFNDGFNYTDQETIELVKWRMFHYINAEFNKQNTKTSNILISGVKLVETVLHSLNIFSFDFYNNKTYLKLEKGFREAMTFLTKKGLIASSLKGKDNFYKFFIRKELFRSREFSNEFEVDMVINLMYNLGYSFKYEVNYDFVDFYKKHLIDNMIKHQSKKIIIDLPAIEDFTVRAIENVVNWQDVSDIVAENDYTSYAEFVSIYNKQSKVVKIIPTKKELTQPDKMLFSKLVLIVNSDNNIKQKFIY